MIKDSTFTKYYDSINNGYIDEEVLEEIAYDKIAEKKLENYVKTIKFINNGKYFYDFYNEDTKSIVINTSNNIYGNNNSSKVIETSMWYRSLIETIYHEIVHAEQLRFKEEIFSYDQVEAKDWQIFYLMKEQSKIYCRNYVTHNYFLVEREANIISVIERIKMDSLLPLKDIKESDKVKKLRVARELFTGYEKRFLSKNISPIEHLDLLKLDRNIILEAINSTYLTDSEKLIYGLPTDYNYLNNLRKLFYSNNDISYSDAVKELKLK